MAWRATGFSPRSTTSSTLAGEGGADGSGGSPMAESTGPADATSVETGCEAVEDSRTMIDGQRRFGRWARTRHAGAAVTSAFNSARHRQGGTDGAEREPMRRTERATRSAVRLCKRRTFHPETLGSRAVGPPEEGP